MTIIKNKIVYIYNNTRVLAKIPQEYFVNFKNNYYKNLFNYNFTFSIKLHSQQNISLKSSYEKFIRVNIEKLHERIIESNNKSKLMSERLLISDSGQLFENKYFDTITTKKIKKVFPSQNILLGNNVFSKVLTQLKVNGLEFLKISIHNTRDRTFVFINKLNCSYNKKRGTNIVKNAPVASFV